METSKLILIIDDEPDFTETVRFFLENSGFRVAVAQAAEEGFEKIKLKPELILLDLNMPKMSGHEVCKFLKEDPVTASIPIIMLTSQDRTLDKVEAFNLGVADYIGKHFPFEEILARIKAVLRETSPAASTQAKTERNKKILELRSIIDEQKLRSFFQPIVKLSDRKPIGYEALTRGPKGSFLENPIDLFNLAKEENMFFELDILCMAQAAKKTAFFSSDHLLFLNTDPSVINRDYFKKMSFLKDSPLDPSRLCIEITERTCITNYTKLSYDLSYFKPMGVKIAIDDVGEGYSSLKAIAELQPEFIKIDIGLVRDVNSDGIKGSLIQVIADLAKKLKSHVIAEGVETEEEYATLLSFGIEYAQGYLFSKPIEQP